MKTYHQLANEAILALKALNDADKIKVLGYILEGELSDAVSDALLDVREAYVAAHDYAMECAA